MDKAVTENHKEVGNEHTSLKEAATNEVNPLNSSVEVGQGDSAQVNPPSAPAVIVDSSKAGIEPRGTHNVISITEHVNNEPSESVPIVKAVSTGNGDSESKSQTSSGEEQNLGSIRIRNNVNSSVLGPEEAMSAVESSADNAVSLDVPANKISENIVPSSSATLSDISSRQLGGGVESTAVPSGENGHGHDHTKEDAPSSEVAGEEESHSVSSIPNLTHGSSKGETPAPSEVINPSYDKSDVAIQDKQTDSLGRTDTCKDSIPDSAAPSTKVTDESPGNDDLLPTNTEEDGSENKVTLSSQSEEVKIKSAQEKEKVPTSEAEKLPVDSVSGVGETTLTPVPDQSSEHIADDQKEQRDAESRRTSVHEDADSSPPNSAADVSSKSVASEDESVRSCAERPKSTVTLPEDESSVNLSETGDDDQEMEAFEHVASKAADGDKDLGEPMSVDVADASVEESMEVTDEDPFGVGVEPETKLDESEEPMDVDDTSDKDKTQDVPDSDEKTPAEPSEEKESDSTANESVVGDTANKSVVGEKLPSDVGKDSSSKVTKSSEENAEQPIELVTTEDESSTEPASANSTEVPTDQPSEEPKDGDEEICIIPDTIRTMGDQNVPDGQATGKDKSEKADDISDKDSRAKLDKDKNKEEKSKPGLGRTPGRRDRTSTSTDSTDKKTEYSGRPQRLAAKRAVSQIKELAKEDSNSGDGIGKFQADDIKEIESSPQMCYQCCRVTACKYQVYIGGQERYLCQEPCYNLFLNERETAAESPVSETQINNTDEDFLRKCGQCATVVTGDEKNLAWETMDFCNEECLGKYQTQLGSYCANCKGPTAPASLGKYCVRFGYDIKQFCCSSCLEEFKKGLKVCSYCQKDISSGTEGFLAPVGDKGQFKDFCRQKCMEKYDNMSNNVAPPVVTHECAVCNNEKVVQYQFILKSKVHKLCSEPCFAAFKFVNNVKEDQCDMCKKYFDKVHTEVFTVYYDDTPHSFCCKTCMNVYILANRKIVPCNWCKVKKYNFDMIKRVVGSGQVIMMCSLNCLTLYQVSVSAVSSKRIKCDLCSGVAQAQYHLTMSDATIRNFCSYQCVMTFQGQYGKTPPLTITGAGDKNAIPTPAVAGTAPIPTGGPKRVYPTRRSVTQTGQNDTPTATANSLGPVISSVQSLAPNSQVSSPTTRAQAHKVPSQANSIAGKQPVLYKQQLVVKPPPPKVMRNKAVFCRPLTVNKGVSCRPHGCNKETQTEDNLGKPVLIPIPVPIYVPAPMHMYCSPFPVPVPFPLPIPVPMFIPTTRHSAQGILREIKRIQEKIPTDPFEAELLMMAEMVADDKKPADSDSESEGGDNDTGDVNEVQGATSTAESSYSPEPVDTSNLAQLGEDMLQMALKMASELDEPAVDLEAALTPSTITAQSNTSIEHNDATESEVDDPEPVANMADRAARGRKRSLPTPRRTTPNKRGRRISSSGGGDMALLPPPEPTNTPRIEQEKPDANMCLKYTFGVNAWRQWVNAKNNELEKAASNNRKLKLFKPEILQLTSDELNYSLCLFVKEVRKPNGTEYAPDTIYYLVLGIQQYLFENGRIDNIFTDPYYEKFTECLDEVAKKFAVLYNDQQYIVTRVEEEHLWESKQLGAHSPHVLLSTLMFFNTKHFNLTTVEEHMQLSFSHIMKHWKRNPNQPGGVAKVPGSRNVLLRFYPPQSSLEANSKKKKVYEQQENEENPLRCPVKLYEFYLSKCPESVKTRNDVFYLLPERSCVPDSPVWYSTMALGKDPLMKMLHRVKMVKEINIALLQS